MKKGSRKRSKTHFKPGHTFGVRKKPVEPSSNTAQLEEAAAGRWIPRLTRSDFAKVVKVSPAGLLQVPDEYGRPGTTKVLRPRPDVQVPLTLQYLKTDNNDYGSEMRLVHMAKTEAMWNTCYREHSQVSGDCLQPNLFVFKELKKGVCWKQGLECSNCTYRSDLFKLYDEVQSDGRGAKTAAPNRGLQVGLQESMCGNSKARVIIATTNTPPPSHSAMQKQSNKVGGITATIVQEDLNRKCEATHEINKLRGLQPDAPINISVYVRYNSNFITSRHKLGQSASQAIGVAVENQTDEKQIISMFMSNKLCWEGSWLRGLGFNVTCPGGHFGCTATSDRAQPLSERKIGEKIGEHLSLHQVLVEHVTTDGDGRSAEGIEAGLALLNPLWQVTRQADTTHLGQSQFRHAMKCNFTKAMFPGPTADDRKEQKKMLSLDIKNRCHAILTIMHRDYSGDIAKICHKLPKIVESTLNCYNGDCSQCRRTSIVCGGGVRNSWWKKSVYLRAYSLQKLLMTADDRHLMKAVLQMKLSEKAVKLMSMYNNTNKNEAINRGISASLPKNVTFSRNAIPRAYAAVDRLNFGLGNSLHRKLAAVGSPVTKGGLVAKSINAMQNSVEYARKYKTKHSVKARALKQKTTQIQQHYQAKSERRDAYKKGQLDDKPKIKTRYTKKYDHSYSKL